MNLIFGAGSFLGFGDTEFTLTDRFGNSVNVDINADYIRQSSDWHTLGEILRKDLLLRLIDDLLIKDMIIQILLTFPNGDSSVFKLYTSKLNPAGGLPVPAHESDSSGTGTSGGTGGSSGVEESWGDRRERWAEEEEAYGFPVCWPDFSQPNETTTVCNPWP